MDSSEDFLIPELLNLIFFQQKSIVIFPYVDQKHLKSLETFTVGHSVIDLDCTVLDDVMSIVEHEAGRYSQNPTFFFIYNASKDLVASLYDKENVHCIINTHEDVSHLAKEHLLVFYNKKNKNFLNWEWTPQELSFEKGLFEQSQGSSSLLHDSLIRIKSFATLIYNAIVEQNNYVAISNLFKEQADTYPPKNWDRILEFMEYYYDIKTPPELFKRLNELKALGKRGSSTISQIKKTSLQDFSSEYDLIIATDRAISNAFIHALHDYRSNYVNSANLELSQLYNPKELFNYLRNHHWKDGLDELFVKEWFKNPDLITDQNSKNVKIMLKKLGVLHELVIKQDNNEIDIKEKADFRPRENERVEEIPDSLKMPSIKDFEKFRTWILDKLDQLESLKR